MRILIVAASLLSRSAALAGEPSVVIERHGDVLYERFSDGREATVEKHGDVTYEHFKGGGGNYFERHGDTVYVHSLPR
jgi:hypothetical protein